MKNEDKKQQIQDLITTIANKTLGITEEQIARARKIYENDERSIEEIKRELERLSEEITAAALRKKEAKAKIEQKVADDDKKKTAEMSNDDDEYYKTEILDFDFGADDIEADVKLEPELIPQSDNLQQSLHLDTRAELSSMFDDKTTEPKAKVGENEKGKSLVKTNSVNNNAGYASALNLAFMMSSISIIGLFIASIIIFASRMIG